MKLRFLHLIILICSVCAQSSCSDSIEFPEGDGNVAIVYWMGDNTLSDNAQADIEELARGKENIPADSKIIIYVDKVNQKPVIYQLDALNGLQIWKELSREQDCTDSLTMLTNLRDIIMAFPAKKYGLTLAAHGTGMGIVRRKALGPDQSNRENWLNVPTLRGILEHLPHMSYVFFDVCFMQSIEVAYELRNVTDWTIGSPAEIPAPGAPYDVMTAELCNGDIEGIVGKYSNYYPRGIYTGVVLSAVKSSELPSLSFGTSQKIKERFANRLDITTDDIRAIQRYSSEFSSYTYSLDMNSSMAHFLQEDDYLPWQELFNKAVPIRSAKDGQWFARFCDKPSIYDEEHFGGVSMYIPMNGNEGEKKNAELKHYQWYTDVGWNKTGW